ncbi:hypothetical protein Tco_1296962, partial [Tanacetum coccineum]
MAGADDETLPLVATPTQQAPHTVSTIKLPILKKGEYVIWAMKMEHYLDHIDYPIWEVMQKGNGPVSVSKDTNGHIKVLPTKTAEEILARERERKSRTTLVMALPKDHLAKFHKTTDAKEMWDAIKSRFSGNDESKKMQKYILKQQFKGFSVSNSEGLHKGYDRTLPSSWSQVSLIMRTKPEVDNLSFDDLYNHLRVFESDVKGSIGSSSSAQNVAFVSSESTSSTNDVSTAYGVSTLSGYNSQRENSSSYTDELMYSFFSNQSSGLQLDHEDLELIDEKEGESCTLMPRNQLDLTRPKSSASIVTTHGILLESADQNGTKILEGEIQGTLDIKQKTMGGDLEIRRNLKLCNSGSDTKVEAQLVCHQKNQLAYEEIMFMKIDLDDKTDVLIYHKKLLAEAVKEKEELKTKLEKWQNSSKGLNKLLDSQMSVKDKIGLGFREQVKENDLYDETLMSVFDSHSSDIEDAPVYDRFAKVDGMHVVPPPMTGNYMPSGPDIEIDESQFTYGPKQFNTSESDANTSAFNSCKSNSSVETLQSVP